jgi:hypothetical protein
MVNFTAVRKASEASAEARSVKPRLRAGRRVGETIVPSTKQATEKTIEKPSMTLRTIGGSMGMANRKTEAATKKPPRK